MPRSSRPDWERTGPSRPRAPDIGTDAMGGVLDAPDGEHGRLRAPDLRPRLDDPLVLRSLIVRTGLRPGDHVEGVLGPAPGGERPEEVTHLRRVVDVASVVDASFDEPAARHTSAMELALQRAMRVVEAGGDALVLVDSLTRLARAYNLAARGRAAGRTLSGGV